MNYIEPFKYPLRNIKRLVLGGLMVFPGVILLFIPFVMSLGYLIRVGEHTLKGEDKLPEFGEYKNLFIKGLGSILIGIVYGFIASLILIPIYFLTAYFFIAISTTSEELSLALALILFFIGFISLLIISILHSIANIKYSEGGSIEHAFKFIEIWKEFKKSVTKYFAACILFLFVIGLFTATCIIFLTHIPPFVYFLILGFGIIFFYFCLVFERMFAQIYKESITKNLKCRKLLNR